MSVIFQIPFKLGLTVQPKKIVPVHATELERPLIPQPALGSSSCLCRGRCWTGTSTHVKRPGGACGSSPSPCISTHLLHVITACQEQVMWKNVLLLAAVPFGGLLLSLLKLTSALLVLSHHFYINMTFLAYLSLLLKSSGSLPSSPQVTESQNHRIVGVGRDLCGSSSPTPLPKQGHLQ